tara:strand:- start:1134 stop:1301 length:168 start_codon:yes stop_codon:yes gene_type:complete
MRHRKEFGMKTKDILDQIRSGQLMGAINTAAVAAVDLAASTAVVVLTLRALGVNL